MVELSQIKGDTTSPLAVSFTGLKARELVGLNSENVSVEKEWQLRGGDLLFWDGASAEAVRDVVAEIEVAARRNPGTEVLVRPIPHA
jgi:hypothetical protein